MLNQVILVGKVVDFTERNNTLVLGVSQLEKNELGSYDMDIISVHVSDRMLDNLRGNIYRDLMVGIKGRLVCGVQGAELTINLEKITYLHTTKGGE